MRKVLVLVAATMLLAGVVHAQVHFEFHCAGTGNMVKNSPIIYSGAIDGGDLAPGEWTVTVLDPQPPWPPTGDDAVRWDYIWTNYYVYDPGLFVWTGTFNNNPLYLEKYSVGSMNGICDLNFQIIDMNGNGIMDPEECADGFSGAVIIIQDGTGDYVQLCGTGTYEGFYFRDCDTGSGTYMLDNVDFNMSLDLEDCGMGTDASTWGGVKSLFR
jgi:hypothetical protein